MDTWANSCYSTCSDIAYANQEVCDQDAQEDLDACEDDCEGYGCSQCEPGYDAEIDGCNEGLDGDLNGCEGAYSGANGECESTYTYCIDGCPLT